MKKILILDDEEHIRFFYSEEVRSEGYEVETLESGRGIIDYLMGSMPDLLIMDIKMTEYSGLDLLKDIKEVYPDLPVVLCSAYDSFKHDKGSREADRYVIKSFDLTELKQIVSEILS